MEIAKTELLEISYIPNVNTLVCSVKDVKITKDVLSRTLAAVSATLITYRSQDARIKWCWDLSRLRMCVDRFAQIERHMKGLSCVIDETVMASAVIFASAELRTVFSGIIRLIDIHKPLKLFQDVPTALLWLKQHGGKPLEKCASVSCSL